MKKWLAVSLSVATVVVAAGCGGDDEEKESGGAGAGPAEQDDQRAPERGGSDEPASGGGAGKTVKISMKDLEFTPESKTVPAGTTVEWTNDDTAPHDVTKATGPGPKFASGKGDMATGDTYRQTFKAPGRVQYVCTIHSGMDGKIIVK